MRGWIASAAMLAAALSTPAPAAAPQQPEGTTTATTPVSAEEQAAFESSDQRMTVPVAIAGAGPFPFVVDTGAERTVVSRELASQLGLPAGRDVRVTAIAAAGTFSTVVLPSITMGPVGHARIEAPAFASADLGASGLIGLDALKGRSVFIDFDTQLMTIGRPQRFRRPPTDGDEIVVRAKSRFGQLIVTNAYLAGRRVRIVVDTGTAVSVGNAALQRLIGTRSIGQVALRDVTGGVLQARYAIVDKLSVGGLGISNLAVAFADARPFRRFGLQDEPALFLGMDALRMFRRVSIDFGNRELRFVLPRELSR